MHHKVILFSLMGILVAGCGSQIENGGSGGASSSSASTGEGGNGGAMGTGGNGGTGGTGGMSSASSSSSSSSSGGGCGFCDFACCGSACINLDNDINNCGACGQKCDAAKPFCDNGVCTTPPCNGSLCGAGGTCCGSNCCMPGELCCNVPGPIGAALGCHMPSPSGTCPTGCSSCQCSAPDTPVATPNGEKPIASLVEGDLVYSVHRGAIMAVPIRTTQRMSVTNHFVMRVELADGRVIQISPGHPTADGHSFADLTRGSSLGGVMVVDVQRVAYGQPFTYDILPNSDTGTYFAAGALIGSTMAKPHVPNASRTDAY